MDFKESDIKDLASKDHEGSDFCSGYTDVFGKWNTGFECPRMRSGETVYCCGTVLYKYCCTRKEHNTGPGISQSVILGTTLGSVVVLILVAVVSCLVCRKCPPYRRAHPSINGGPFYNLHCSSTTSGMTNLYSGQTTASTTPHDNAHIMIDMDAMNLHRASTLQMSRMGLRYDAPSDPPPPYNEQQPMNGDAVPMTINTIHDRVSSSDACGGVVNSELLHMKPLHSAQSEFQEESHNSPKF
ncbi:protein shisa-like-2B isoform X2 [Uloborus diversus]|uniref:protein shisa-like-2B isoform X2 n=1 Tax=Uloborus diversus TaxID=327109 RepID=UPI0024094CCD|nr:protein shisa-like-2B isoform X2 [Uloborus diversus]